MILKIKRSLFKLLDSVVNKQTNKTLKIANDLNNSDLYYWCFCTTIGELNACKSLIKEIPEKYQLVLFTDRDIYEESYLKAFPQAIVITLDGGLAECQSIASKFPPSKVLVCEIPIRLHDAPCRLSFELLYLAKKLNAPIHLVNGWLYHYSPSCKQDAFERYLFDVDYLNLFDLITVQTNEVKEEIESIIGKSKKLHVTGNMKFDALSDKSFIFKDHISERLLELYKDCEDPIFIAGCVSQFWEYDLVLNAYKQAIETLPNLKLIIAPRHPENTEHMAYLTTKLAEVTKQGQLKSEIKNQPEVLDSVLVLNTVGELKAYYSIADLCYVGKNHNVLEPLAFNKPIAVKDDWEKTYPSYPVYRATLSAKLICEVKDSTQLYEWIEKSSPMFSFSNNTLDTLTGATNLNIKHLRLS